jgi:hypothetical protein
MNHESTTTQNTEKIKPYSLVTESARSGFIDDSPSVHDKKALSMIVSCRACGREFESTFTNEDFAKLPLIQKESGTLHICPHCGNLGLYAIRDYHEGRKQN